MIFVTHYIRLQLSTLSRQNIVTVMRGLGCASCWLRNNL